MYGFVGSLINYLKVEAMLKNYGLYITITKNVDHVARNSQNSSLKKKKSNNPIRKWARGRLGGSVG